MDVRLEKNTIWANLNQIARLFDRDKSVISRHIKQIFKEKELDPSRTVAKNAQVAKDGRTREMNYYNLDMHGISIYMINREKEI